VGPGGVRALMPDLSSAEHPTGPEDVRRLASRAARPRGRHQPSVVLKVWKDMPKYWLTLLRSSFIGCWLGITPGGAIAASFMGL
jgi:TctA family transporter